MYEKDSVEVGRLGGYIYKSAIGAFPNGMKLGFDEHFRPDPNSPADVLFATVSGHLLWNDRETFVDWLRHNWTQVDVLLSLIHI